MQAGHGGGGRSTRGSRRSRPASIAARRMPFRTDAIEPTEARWICQPCLDSGSHCRRCSHSRTARAQPCSRLYVLGFVAITLLPAPASPAAAGAEAQGDDRRPQEERQGRHQRRDLRHGDVGGCRPRIGSWSGSTTRKGSRSTLLRSSVTRVIEPERGEAGRVVRPPSQDRPGATRHGESSRDSGCGETTGNQAAVGSSRGRQREMAGAVIAGQEGRG